MEETKIKYNILAAWHLQLEHKDIIFTIDDGNFEDEDLINEMIELMNEVKLRSCVWEVQKDLDNGKL